MSANKRNLFTIEDFKTGADRALHFVELPNYPRGGKPGVAIFKQLTTAEVLKFADMPENTEEEKAAKKQAQYTLLAKGLCDEDGKLLYTAETADEILEMPMGMFTELMTEFMKFLGLSPEAAKDADPGKGSGSTPSDASPSN